MRAVAIIPAAGQGKRFGGATAKQFIALGGKPLLLHTLERFQQARLIDEICLVLPEVEREAFAVLLERHPIPKLRAIIAGGKERQDSVANGFRSLSSCDVVVVHDGVRPFIAPELIDCCVETAAAEGGCVVGVPVKETTKEIAADGLVQRTVDRRNLWTIQTPQAFRYELFQRALARATEDHFHGTDEAMLVERIGGRVKVLTGSYDNIKVTTPEDLAVAETLLARFS